MKRTWWLTSACFLLSAFLATARESANRSHPVQPPDSSWTDLRVTNDVETGELTIDWLRHYRQLHIRVSDAQAMFRRDHDFADTENGSLDISWLPPGIYFIGLWRYDGVPLHHLVVHPLRYVGQREER